jgi:hypothetical protein
MICCSIPRKRTNATNKNKRAMATLGSQNGMVSPWSRDLKLKPTVKIVFHSLAVAKGCWENWDVSEADDDKYLEWVNKIELFQKIYEEAKAKKPLLEPCPSGHRRKDCPKGKAHHSSNKDESFRIRRLFDTCPNALGESSSMQNYFGLIEVEITDRIRHGKGENLPSFSYRDDTTLPPSPPVVMASGLFGNGYPLGGGAMSNPVIGCVMGGKPRNSQYRDGWLSSYDQPADAVTDRATAWHGFETGSMAAEVELESPNDSIAEGSAEIRQFTTLNDSE